MAARTRTRSSVPPPVPPHDAARARAWLRALEVLALLFAFLVGVRALSAGFHGLGSSFVNQVFSATENPFAGLIVGILATTLLQSSSATTSMIVALVAAPENPLPVANAIPMVMGANIGTTVTNTLVSLAHAARPDEFRRAFAAATVHDFFNFFAVLVLLPLELVTGVLAKASASMASVVGTGGPGTLPNPIKSSTKAVVGLLERAIATITDDARLAGALLVLLAAVLIFTTLALVVRTLRRLAATRLQLYITGSLDKSGWIGIAVGLVATVIVQSSSITTSVLVPLAGAGIVSTTQVFPITLGANLGTTLTALIASMAAPAETAHLAVQVALVHLLFNVAGIALVYPLRAVRRLPIALSERFAAVAQRSRRIAIAYVVVAFYGLPALLIFAYRLL